MSHTQTKSSIIKRQFRSELKKRVKEVTLQLNDICKKDINVADLAYCSNSEEYSKLFIIGVLKHYLSVQITPSEKHDKEIERIFVHL